MILRKRHAALSASLAKTAGPCIVAISTVLLMAACSSSSGSSQGSSAQATTSSAGGTASGGSPASSSGGSQASGAAIKVGVISSDTGPAGNNNDAKETVKRWEAYTNSHGGINGHPVNVIELDDQFNPTINVQDAKTLIEQDKVIAILDNSFVSDAMAKTVDDAKVPVLGMGGGHNSHNYEVDPNYFTPVAPPPSGTAFQISKEIQLSGAKKAALLYCGEVAACAGVPAQVEKLAPSLGFQVVYKAAFTASQPNYTAICLAAKSAGADGMFTVGADPTADYKVYTDCAQQGYKPAVSAASLTLGKEIYQPNSQVYPVTMGFTTLPPTINVPGNKLFHQVMDSYLPQASSSAGVAEVWAGLEMFKATLANAGPNPTSQDVYNGLYAFHGETLGGFVAPMTFTKGKPSYQICVFSTRVDRGKVTTPDGTAPICEKH